MPDDYERFTAPRHDEEMHQSHVSTFAMGMSPEDGLPTLVTPQNLDKSPGLSEETLVCMADKRSFVIRGADGSVLVTFKPNEVGQLHDGRYFVSKEYLKLRLHKSKRKKLSPVEVLGPEGYENIYVVEPIRPECVHYLRSLSDLAADRERNFYQRACMAQKSEEGEYYSLRDVRLSACNIRSPRHLASEALMDEFDQKLMTEAKTAREMEEFDVDKALSSEKGKLGVLG